MQNRRRSDRRRSVSLATWVLLAGYGCGSMPGAEPVPEVRVAIERIPNDAADSSFAFGKIPGPRTGDAASGAAVRVLSGTTDANSGKLTKLTDDRLPTQEDQPDANVFCAAGKQGARLVLDLGREVAIGRVGSFSWHPGWRAPQVYDLYGRSGAGEADAAEGGSGDPASQGWSLVARVDTRGGAGDPGGQHGVSVSRAEGSLGMYRRLLFDIKPTETQDPFGHTFFSEIDVIDARSDASRPIESASPKRVRDTVMLEGGHQLELDTTEAEDLRDWARAEVIPMVREWYPKLVQRLASEGFRAPATVRIRFDGAMEGVADTSGARVRCAAAWFRANLKGEALGAVFHELVHVVQQYQSAPRRDGFRRAPGWVVEGIADYLRWYHFEPGSGGAAIRPEKAASARPDASYRVTANFLDWVTRQGNPETVTVLNRAAREGRYREEIWKELTGRTLAELGEAWRKALAAPQQGKPGGL